MLAALFSARPFTACASVPRTAATAWWGRYPGFFVDLICTNEVSTTLQSQHYRKVWRNVEGHNSAMWQLNTSVGVALTSAAYSSTVYCGVTIGIVLTWIVLAKYRTNPG
ncbi:hypothetical protein PSPO01_14102 [Paraphaeosphaeria sporulosa]